MSAGAETGGAPAPRGRARSHSFHADGSGDLVAADLGLAPPPVGAAAAPSGAPAAAAGSGRTKGLSRKTLNVLNDIDGAVNFAGGAGSGSGSGASSVGDPGESAELAAAAAEAAAAEAELEALEAENTRRAAAAGNTGGGAGALHGIVAPSLAGVGGSSHPPDATSVPAGAPSGGSRGARRGAKPDEKDFDHLVKLLLLGDSGTGKTSLMLRFAEEKFSGSLLSTAGVDYKTCMLDVDGTPAKLQIWDTAGQQRFHVITQAYYRGAHGIVLVYDCAGEGSEESFRNVRHWVENITKHANPHCVKVLIGNKIDVKPRRVRAVVALPALWWVCPRGPSPLAVNTTPPSHPPTPPPQIDTARGRALAEEFGMRFFETSAKDGTGVREAFTTPAREVVRGLRASTAGKSGGGDKPGQAAGKGDKDKCVIV